MGVALAGNQRVDERKHGSGQLGCRRLHHLQHCGDGAKRLERQEGSATCGTLTRQSIAKTRGQGRHAARKGGSWIHPPATARMPPLCSSR